MWILVLIMCIGVVWIIFLTSLNLELRMDEKEKVSFYVMRWIEDLTKYF